MTMRRNQRGFSLIELMIALAIVFLLLGVVTAFFIKVLSGYKTQTKLTESNLESNLGLEILRRDIASAGYGLPWNGLIAYSESTVTTDLNEPLTTDAPRAVASINYDAAPDILTVKSMSVTDQAAGRRFMVMNLDNDTGTLRARTLNDQNDDFESTNQVVVIQPGVDSATRRSLVSGGTSFSNAVASFSPPTIFDIRLVYGVTDNTALRMPFNRADYWIDNTGTYVDVPGRCEPNTGVLVKGVVSHDNGSYFPVLPLLDCVRDMQVSYRYTDNVVLTNAIGTVGATAEEIRENLREVRVFVLAQEGARDPSYTHGETSIYLGDAGLGRTNTITGDALHYRWRVYRLFVAPDGMGN